MSVTSLDKLAEFVSTAILRETYRDFSAREKFLINENPEARVKISGLDENFGRWFLEGDGKIERPFRREVLIRGFRLRKKSRSDLLIRDMGGEQKAETSLTAVYLLMAEQPNGEGEGALSTDWANVFCIGDMDNVLRMVRVDSIGRGWDICARDVNDGREWFKGDLAFSYAEHDRRSRYRRWQNAI